MEGKLEMDDRGMDLEMEGTRADAAPAVSGGGWTPKAVEEALVQAFALEARLPDRERGWLTVGLSPVWRQMGRDRMDWPDPDAPRPRAGKLATRCPGAGLARRKPVNFTGIRRGDR
jgi:hypothetical protein